MKRSKSNTEYRVNDRWIEIKNDHCVDKYLCFFAHWDVFRASIKTIRTVINR